jgi:Mg-chelatase subunit ChlD
MRAVFLPVLTAAGLTLLAALPLVPPAAAADESREYTIPKIAKDDVERLPIKDGVQVVRVRFKVLHGRDGALARDIGPKLAKEEKNDEGFEIEVREDGQLVKNVRLTVFPREVKKERIEMVKVTVPLQVVLVIDCSGSMRDRAEEGDNKSKIEAMHESASAFIRTLPSKSAVSLLPFSDNPSDKHSDDKEKQQQIQAEYERLGIGLPSPFSEDRNNLQENIRRLKPLGGTLLYDAIHDGIATLEATRRPGKRVVVVLTDGKDEFPGSRHSPDDVVNYAKETGTPLFLLGLGREREINEPVMRDMAERTDGRYQRARNQAELFKLFEGLAQEFQKSVVSEQPQQVGEYFELEYDSPRPIQDGTYRPVEIQLLRKGDTISNKATGGYANRGVVIPEMNPLLYLPLLGVLGALVLLPYGLSRLGKLGAKS